MPNIRNTVLAWVIDAWAANSIIFSGLSKRGLGNNSDPNEVPDPRPGGTTQFWFCKYQQKV